MKVLLIAPNIDATDVGEAFVAYKWASALSERVELTVLAFQRPERPDLATQLPFAEVVTWPEPAWARKNERINAMLKPAWPHFAHCVRKWLRTERKEGRDFDLAHQLMPQAARYASPLRHFPIPYVIGPLGGALDTPESFQSEAASAPLFTRLRKLDRLRFKYDPFLRETYQKAACVLGVAPYVRDVLQDIPLQRFEPVLELGIDNVEPMHQRQRETGKLRVLHVGRAVRTKGLRDTVRALAHLKSYPGITLTSAGAGEEIDPCRAEAARLGVGDRVSFLGKIPREDVEALYVSHDVFCFPSFREPAGGVLYEAMRHGLPVVTADRGGPSWIIDAASGVRIPVSDPETYARDIAESLRMLADNPVARSQLGAGARNKVLREGLWEQKADRLVTLYRSVVHEPIASGLPLSDSVASHL
jgi:glycosyltransferase involved in cell wall biosynthesis